MLLLAEHFPQELKNCITEEHESGHEQESPKLSARAKKHRTRRFRVRLYGKAAYTRTGGTVERRNDVLVTDEFYTCVRVMCIFRSRVVRKDGIRLS